MGRSRRRIELVDITAVILPVSVASMSMPTFRLSEGNLGIPIGQSRVNGVGSSTAAGYLVSQVVLFSETGYGPSTFGPCSQGQRSALMYGSSHTGVP
ncbi:hypothetical protein HD554DRAFT_2131015 [Boletus coccyginus]|nr:hypothetical protein HD554DRAFT_2131015 [Boletus coccyginus]